MPGRTSTRSGSCCIRCSAGVPPFDGESAQSILMKAGHRHSGADPAAPERGPAHAPPPLVDRALAKDPAERFQTAEELSRALVDALPTASAGQRADALSRPLRGPPRPRGPRSWWGASPGALMVCRSHPACRRGRHSPTVSPKPAQAPGCARPRRRGAFTSSAQRRRRYHRLLLVARRGRGGW